MMRGWAVVAAMSAAGCYGDQRAPAPDAALAPETPAPITLTYLADEIELAGLPVYFQNPDSSLALATRTDGHGRVRGFVAPGGFVTIVLPGGGMYTYAGVREGDELLVDERSFENETDSIELALSAPASPGADVYVLSTTCGLSSIELADGVPASSLVTACASTSDVVISARSQDPRPFGSNHRYLFRKDAALDPGSVLAFDGEFQPLLDVSVSVTSMPAAPARVTLSQALVRGRYAVTPPKSVTVDAIGGAASGEIDKMYTPTDGTTLTRVVPAPLGVSAQTTLVWGPSQATTAVDGALQLRAFTTRPELVANASHVRWTEAPAGDAGDLVFVALTWTAGDRELRWQLVSPRDAAAIVHYPVLPSAELVPPPSAAITQLATLAVGPASTARTTLLGSWPANDAWLADTETGRADYHALLP